MANQANWESGPTFQPEIGLDREKQRKEILGLAPGAVFALVALGQCWGRDKKVGHVHCPAKRFLTVLCLATAAPFSTPSRTDAPTIAASSIGSGIAAASSIAAAPPKGLTIIQAIYAAVDVTAQAKASMPQGPYLVLNMSDTSPWAGPDPWVDVRKCLALLHSWGSSIRTFVACDSDGPFILLPGNVSLSLNTQEITRMGPSSPNFALVSVVWGAAEIRTADVYQALYQYRLNGSAVPFGNPFFEVDTLYGVKKSGVVWYTEDNFLTFKSIFAREGESVLF
jgi:hypothetical protein